MLVFLKVADNAALNLAANRVSGEAQAVATAFQLMTVIYGVADPDI